ncbi:Disease resistance protein (CC-NBS-LRR class) family [Rhynchospora pubera]|uniref:Disease resistance protein (CC-NBS-LRR class) family n=1 Tax=Rhynchospora pubera TaxID=906938 RepID=A0AAV8GVT5_9POAL|nr:Disease resistance protein (CC-NBS-LRR class) family [Rhynchospora pubera]
MAEISAATAVGWVVSPVIKMVIEKTTSFIQKKYFGKSDIEDGMKKMKTTLLEILSTMAIVDQHRIVDPNQVLLVRQIKDAIYDTEDCMADFDYELAKKKNEKLLAEKKNKVGCVAASCSRVIHQAIDGYSSVKKTLTEVNKSLDQAKASAKTLLELMNANFPGNMQLPEQENQSMTSSLLSEKLIVGRENERELMIKWILEEKSGPPTIIPILGQGGLGKTTLAQIVFNDPRLNGHFESNKKMWLTISDNFDKFELTKQMLKYLCENFSTKDATFDMLQRKLQTELVTKKILLVLDDVWYGKHDNKYRYEKNWLEFIAPLSNANAGSTIIVTTREEVVVDTLKSWGSIRKIFLGGLDGGDGWSLLKLMAFDGENYPDNLQHLETIGKKIVNKLKGLPLAIRVVGPRLRSKLDKEEWESVLEDNSLDNDIMEVLQRSYEHLPGHLQLCFAYCSLFPKDYYLKRDRLVHMWIAHGFVLPKAGKKLEDVGKSYFSELIARSFIQVIKRNNKEYYVMHDLMNELACHVSKGECYILKEGDTLENLGSVKHLSVCTTETDHLVNIRGLDKLRTLIFPSYLDFFDARDEFEVMGEVLIKMKKIRVLDINYEFPLPNIGECKLLHYLSFRNDMNELAPDTFSKLHLLTVLFIRKGSISEDLALPESIFCKSRLEFIDTSKSIQMELGGRVQLHSVWRGGSASFDVDKKKRWELGHLQYFDNIKGILTISELQNVASREKATEAQLGSREHVTELQLYWSWKSRVVKSNIEHNEILEALKPHPNIEWLRIGNYPGDKFPSWLEPNYLSRMKHIYLQGSRSRFQILPALGQFSQLKTVAINFIHTVKIGDEFYGNGVFPSLENLRFRDMISLKEWSSPSRAGSFPKLLDLSLIDCPDLSCLPEMESFYSLKEVIFENCPKIRSLPKLPVSLERLTIKRLHPDLEEQLRNKNGPEWEKVAAVSRVELHES